MSSGGELGNLPAKGAKLVVSLLISGLIHERAHVNDVDVEGCRAPSTIQQRLGFEGQKQYRTPTERRRLLH
eukprot:scaffold7260_cov97-Skeletonema_dohrnii-CCMP3373.AAC.3